MKLYLAAFHRAFFSVSSRYTPHVHSVYIPAEIHADIRHTVKHCSLYECMVGWLDFCFSSLYIRIYEYILIYIIIWSHSSFQFVTLCLRSINEKHRLHAALYVCSARVRVRRVCVCLLVVCTVYSMFIDIYSA